MSTRLATGGRLIDRARSVNFRFNGRAMHGHPGDTLSAALLANGQTLMGRSFKYHRPRGAVASGAEEPNALVNMGEGARFEPNQRATTTELFDGLTATSQNHWPSLEFDVGAINNRFARFLPGGFYYKTFMYPRAFWKSVYEPFIRRSAGLGKAPTDADADRYEYFYAYIDVLVIGGGVAGLAAARAAAASGAKVMLVEQTPHWGGRAVVDGDVIDAKPAEEWVAETRAALADMPNVTLRARTMGTGVYDHGYVTLYERVADHTPGDGRPRHRLWRVRARQTVIATGALERPLAFAGNDVPGVMLASATRDYVVNFGVAPGKRTLIVTNNDDAYRTAIALKEAGLNVPAILDARPVADGALPERARALGIRVETGHGVAKVRGTRRVEAVEICAQGGEGAVLDVVTCDVVAMSGGWSPVVHLWSHSGGKLNWDEARAMFRPDAARPPTGADGAGFVLAAGAANGALRCGEVLTDAHAQGKAAAKAVGAPAKRLAAPKADDVAEGPLQPVWIMPERAPAALKEKMWLDFQNDVKVSDVELAAREGYMSVEHTKRYTTLGMATDQGKLSNINGLAVLAGALNSPIPQIGTTTFRPPYTPVSIGAMAGEARGAIFKPTRKTAMDDWHDANGAYWEPVGDWRRPYCYQRAGESVEAAVHREVINARSGLAILDASTLGKILVSGPDAGRFLDMMYTNMMSTLKPGRCRYGLMCGENGFLLDDGVVARLDENTFLCHTTTGGSDRIHAHMEEWLQTEWWDWKVYTANITEQWAQIAVVGPKAREVLEALGSMDVSEEALTFMGWAAGEIAGIPARIFRISFSGEASYEVSVPAGFGRVLWDRLLEAGEAFGVMPYGTEALHVMRAEVGFIMINDETDGTTTPQDLNLHWAISKKKTDFLGKRAQERADLVRPDRWTLVGFETEDPATVLPDGVYAPDGTLLPTGIKRTVGRVTSSYFSPTLGRSIAMGLVERGTERMGDVLSFPTTDGRNIRAKIVEPVFVKK